MRRRITLVCSLALFAFGPLFAQAPTPKAAPPTATAEQRLRAQNLALRLENAQLKMQQAQVEYQQAQADASAFVASMQRDGYTFNPQTLTYTRTAEKDTTKK